MSRPNPVLAVLKVIVPDDSISWPTTLGPDLIAELDRCTSELTDDTQRTADEYEHIARGSRKQAVPQARASVKFAEWALLAGYTAREVLTVAGVDLADAQGQALLRAVGAGLMWRNAELDSGGYVSGDTGSPQDIAGRALGAARWVKASRVAEAPSLLAVSRLMTVANPPGWEADGGRHMASLGENEAPASLHYRNRRRKGKVDFLELTGTWDSITSITLQPHLQERRPLGFGELCRYMAAAHIERALT